MENSAFDYGTFSVVNKTVFKERAMLEFPGEFKPVVFTEKQKKNFKKFALKVQRLNQKKERAEKRQALRNAVAAEKQRKKQEQAASRVKHPIGVKLISIISTIVIVSLTGLAWLVSAFVSKNTIQTARQNNFVINSRMASDLQNRIDNVVSNVSTFTELVKNAEYDENPTAAKEFSFSFFSKNPEIVAIFLPSSESKFLNFQFLGENELDETSVDSYIASEDESFLRAQQGNFVIQNASPFFSVPVLSLFYPVSGSTDEEPVAVLFSTEKIVENFSSESINKSIFVNEDGIVLVSSDVQETMRAEDFGKSQVVQEMLKGGEESLSSVNKQSEFSDGETFRAAGKEVQYIGAFNKLKKGNAGVVTVVPTYKILEETRKITTLIAFLAVAILAVVIIVIWFFSKTMSVPLKQLTAVVNQINKGDFNTELFGDLKTHGNDEIGVLIKSTKNEREILNTFTKLTNKGVTQAIIRKEIDFEPHLKDITIFFSDIRGFTEISDGFKNRFGERSAAEIINFLNDYMSRMVSCIKRTGGTVDKFEGDAIMACWGVLRQEPLDWENLPDDDPEKIEMKAKHDLYVKEDALAAIRSALAMRYSLMEYNKEAEQFTKEHAKDKDSVYKPQIKNGSGMNSGRATVGFMGSYDKMEFTSIGDAVNFASRTEASNKPCGTDMLITEDTYDILKKDCIRCRENNFSIKPENLKNEIIVERIPVGFEVKGKGIQHFYGVVNMPNFDIAEFFEEIRPGFTVDSECEKVLGPKGPRTIAEVRSLLGIATPDFEKVNLNETESKIQVASD